MKIKNTLSGNVEEFIPNDYSHIKMYVCGPTIYDKPHIGNARSLIVFDNLYRVLLNTFNKVTYVRNITDVDDKIMKKAKQLKMNISDLTTSVYDTFKKSSASLNILPPTFEPKATENIEEMISFIQKLIDNGKAYISHKHVLFDVFQDFYYGCLSKKCKEDLRPGSRVEIKSYKKNPLDFVLWKPSVSTQVGWDSPWGFGRPGWHIECSAMCKRYFGDSFDIHGGGQDLIFPHHENEISQNRYYNNETNRISCNYWIHNGLLLLNGKKMSKSLRNVIFIEQAVSEYDPETIRYFFASVHYSKPCDWTKENLLSAKNSMDALYRSLNSLNDYDLANAKADHEFLECVRDDLNFPKGIARLHTLASEINKEQDQIKKVNLQKSLIKSGTLFGVFQKTASEWFCGTDFKCNNLSVKQIEDAILKRNQARELKDFKTADEIRNYLKDNGIIIEDLSNNKSSWRKL